MSDNCIFCKIVKGEIPSKKVYEDELFMAFYDLYPKAKTHVLVIPKQHIESLAHLSSQDAELMGKLTTLLPKLAKELGLHDGFRTIVNTGAGGGQEVPHLHYHILAG
ncbi:MAG: histidine triad nucleotide-binding protein [Gammaproteobacteria bacterium]|jgi:histidine triad (HIT) family protein|nr:histidine triad nucleotide-binding protein [Gammaproteobacteria bacterium]